MCILDSNDQIMEALRELYETQVLEVVCEHKFGFHQNMNVQAIF